MTAHLTSIVFGHMRIKQKAEKQWHYNNRTTADDDNDVERQ
jgi:hypothetical protein